MLRCTAAMGEAQDLGIAATLGLGVATVIHHLSLLPWAEANLFASLGSGFVTAVIVYAQA